MLDYLNFLENIICYPSRMLNPESHIGLIPVKKTFCTFDEESLFH